MLWPIIGIIMAAGGGYTFYNHEKHVKLDKAIRTIMLSEKPNVPIQKAFVDSLVKVLMGKNAQQVQLAAATLTQQGYPQTANLFSQKYAQLMASAGK